MIDIIDASNDAWQWITFDGAKSHAVHRPLVEAIIKDMAVRGCPIDTMKPMNELWFDVPGPAFLDMPSTMFELDGLCIEIPCCDVTLFADSLKNLKERENDGQIYYKLHGFHRCLVLGPEQKNTLQRALEEASIESERQADEFITKWRTEIDRKNSRS